MHSVATGSPFENLIIGAGPAATGVALALLASGDGVLRQSTLIATGEALRDPALARSTLAPHDVRPEWSEPAFGLPAVRAFGNGGTSALWHGGLFVPDPQDRLSDCRGDPVDLNAMLSDLTRSPYFAALPISDALADIAVRASTTDGNRWRTILVPRGRPSLISPAALPLPASVRFDTRMVIRLDRGRHRTWRAWLSGPEGIQVVEARRIVLAAGCLATLRLLAPLSGQSELGFTDHLHVFAGIVHAHDLPAVLRENIRPRRSAVAGYTERRTWKTHIRHDGMACDVALSFRAVADPEFPRAGRRYGRFIGSRATGMMGKMALAARHPITAIEMLLYKLGMEIPFNTYLVHATVAPHGRVGSVSAEAIDFAPDVALLAEGVAIAFEEMCRENRISYGRITRPFSNDDIARSMISGAQFSSGLGEPALSVPDSDGLIVADMANMGFTSVYNQTLLSITSGYRHGRTVLADRT